LLGSDAPQIFNVPGFSIHREIEGMVRAGLSPLEILRSGTINVARYLDMEGRIGEIKVGFEADALLIRDNPLIDLAALREIQGVLVRGRWIPKEEIDRRLKEIEDNAAKQ
ncbi:MAG: amidohydrolase family protein, partial [Flavobacteriaceae bacterium]